VCRGRKFCCRGYIAESRFVVEESCVVEGTCIVVDTHMRSPNDTSSSGNLRCVEEGNFVVEVILQRVVLL